MTTISTNKSGGIDLTTPTYTNPIIVKPDITVAGNFGGYAMYAGSGSWTIANSGSIVGSAANVGGIRLAGGGAVTNQSGGVIGFPASNPGAVYVLGGEGTVSNAGIVNAGVWLQAGGTVSNLTGGTIASSSTSGGYGVGMHVAGIVTNAGSISGPLTGIGLDGGGTVTNQFGGTISGAVGGVLLGFPGSTPGGGYLINQTGAKIAGGDGIIGSGGIVTVNNAGVIVATSSGVFQGNGVTLAQGDGVLLNAGGSVTNQSSGAISGVMGVSAQFQLTVVNSGGITGSSAGIYVVNSTGTVFNTGQIIASGTSTARGVELFGGGYLSNAKTGVITSTGNGNAVRIQSATGTIVNAGMMTNNFSGRSAVAMQAGGSLTNMTGGLIQGGAWNGVYGTGGPMTIVNAGMIAGDGTGSSNSIQLVAGGAITNVSGGTITAPSVTAISITGGPGTVMNAGLISSGAPAAIDFAAGFADRLIDVPGAAFAGTVNGGNTAGAVVVSTLELASGAASGTISGLGTQFINFGSITIDPGANWFVAGDATGLAGAITGFAQGDTIEITGITATGSNYSGGVLTLTEASGTATLDLAGSFSTRSFAVTNVAGGTNITLACFREGTHIRTDHGEVPVERLRVGDQIETLLGGSHAPVVWTGRRTVNCGRHPKPQQVWPVRIRAGTFGYCLPRYDLFLSPNHAVYFLNVLIPVRCLLNGASIAQISMDEVTYYHVELPSHDVLLAEGMPAESYLNVGDRSDFERPGEAVRLFPEFLTSTIDYAGFWETKACAPLIVTGATLQDAWRQVDGRWCDRVAPALSG